MERQGILKEQNIFILLTILYSVGVAGHSYHYTYPYMIMITPYTLVLTGMIVLTYIYIHSADKRFALWCLGVFVITFVLEAVGVATGLIFGRYIYGDVLGLKILGVPLIIGFNWMFIALGAISISVRIFRKPFKIGVSAAFLAVLFDYLLEPVAVNLGYWQWADRSIPLQNYAAWGIFVFAAAYSFSKLNFQKPQGALAEKYFFIQLIFFCLLNIILAGNSYSGMK